jgi:hypothetical protein
LNLLDLTNKENKYDFHIENADLNQLNLVNDSCFYFREMLLCRFQEIPLKIYKETLTFKKPLSKKKDTYDFDDFNIRSSFDEDRVRTINVNSPDIIEGEIVGKFQFAELGNLVKNSLGSLYTNFKANKVSKGQF